MSPWWKVFAGLAAIVAPWAVVYWLASYEHAGSLMMAAFVLAFLFLAGTVFLQGRGLPVRPEDRPDGKPSDAEEDLGFFPSRSVWPFVIGVAAMVVAYGLVFSGWVALPGVALLAIAAAGYAAEAQRADQGTD